MTNADAEQLIADFPAIEWQKMVYAIAGLEGDSVILMATYSDGAREMHHDAKQARTTVMRQLKLEPTEAKPEPVPEPEPEQPIEKLDKPRRHKRRKAAADAAKPDTPSE